MLTSIGRPRSANRLAPASNGQTEGDHAKRHDARLVLQFAVRNLAARADAGSPASTVPPLTAPFTAGNRPRQSATDLLSGRPDGQPGGLGGSRAIGVCLRW